MITLPHNNYYAYPEPSPLQPRSSLSSPSPLPYFLPSPFPSFPPPHPKTDVFCLSAMQLAVSLCFSTHCLPEAFVVSRRLCFTWSRQHQLSLLHLGNSPDSKLRLSCKGTFTRLWGAVCVKIHLYEVFNMKVVFSREGGVGGGSV